MIRLATPNDISIIADIHSQSLPKDYLPQLGKEVLHGYYKTFMKKNPVIVFEEKKYIRGFIALSIYSISLKGFFIEYFKTIILKLILQPGLWCQTLWFAFYYKGHNYNYPEISFIAVKKEYRGVGIGSKLITWVCNFLSKKGVEYLRVKTEVTNINTDRFYKKNMFRFVSIEKRANRNFNVYLREVEVANS